MRSMIAIQIIALLVGLTLVEETWARGGGGRGGGGFGGGYFGGGGRGGFSGGHFGHPGWEHGFYGQPRGYSSFGFYVGPNWGWPGYYPPYYSPYYSYPSTVIEVPVSPPVYIEQGNTSTATGPRYWNYCDNPEGYSPYVRECPAGWQKIAANPASQEPGYWYRCPNPDGYYPYIRDCPAGWQKLIPEPVATHTPP